MIFIKSAFNKDEKKYYYNIVNVSLYYSKCEKDV